MGRMSVQGKAVRGRGPTAPATGRIFGRRCSGRVTPAHVQHRRETGWLAVTCTKNSSSVAASSRSLPQRPAVGWMTMRATLLADVRPSAGRNAGGRVVPPAGGRAVARMSTLDTPAHAGPARTSARRSAGPLALDQHPGLHLPAAAAARPASPGRRSWPRAITTARSHTASTSGRMCVDSITVWSPPRSRISLRVSRICVGSSPTVGSSRIMHGRVVQQRVGQPHPLAIPLGQLPDHGAATIGQPAPVQHVVDPLSPLTPGASCAAGRGSRGTPRPASRCTAACSRAGTRGWPGPARTWWKMSNPFTVAPPLVGGR